MGSRRSQKTSKKSPNRGSSILYSKKRTDGAVDERTCRTCRYGKPMGYEQELCGKTNRWQPELYSCKWWKRTGSNGKLGDFLRELEKTHRVTFHHDPQTRTFKICLGKNGRYICTDLDYLYLSDEDAIINEIKILIDKLNNL